MIYRERFIHTYMAKNVLAFVLEYISRDRIDPSPSEKPPTRTKETNPTKSTKSQARLVQARPVRVLGIGIWNSRSRTDLYCRSTLSRDCRVQLVFRREEKKKEKRKERKKKKKTPSQSAKRKIVGKSCGSSNGTKQLSKRNNLTHAHTNHLPPQIWKLCYPIARPPVQTEVPTLHSTLDTALARS